MRPSRTVLLALALALALARPAAANPAPAPPPEFVPVVEMLLAAEGSPVRAVAYTDMFDTGDGFLLVDRRALALDRYDRFGKRGGGGPLAGADLPVNCSAFVHDPAGGRLYAIDRDRDRLLAFTLDGRLASAVPVRGEARAKRRIAQIDAKTYEWKGVTVHLDFLTGTVAWEEGRRRRAVRYDGLHPGCEAFAAGGRFYFRDPRARLIAPLPDFSPRLTGETLVAAGGGALFLIDRVRNEATRLDAAGEAVAVHAPVDRRGPFVEDVAVFPDGGYALLDGRDARIWLFAADGERQAVFGAKGDGPGRMEGPTDLVALPGDRLLVRDAARGRALVFDRAGRFLAEMQDLIEGPVPAEFRAFLDRDGRVHLVHLRERRIHPLRGTHAWLREFSRLLSSSARYPREYFTLAPDGSILYFDSGKSSVEALSPDAAVAARPVAEGLARFLELAPRRYGPLAFDGRTVYAATEEGRLDAIDPSTGAVSVRPAAARVVAVAADPFGALFVHRADGALERLAERGHAGWRLPVRAREMLLCAAGSGELFAAERGAPRVSLLAADGKRLAAFDLPPGAGAAAIAARADRVAVFFERDGLLGVARYRRREVYREADLHYTNGQYRMAAVRYEEMISRGHDGPALRERLLDCYRRLDRADLAERERLHLLQNWPDSEEAARLRRAAPGAQSIPPDARRGSTP